MAAQSFDQLLITSFNALSAEQKPPYQAKIDGDNPSDSSSGRTPSRRKSRPPSLKLDMDFVTRVNQALQALPASPASSRLPKALRNLHHGNLNVQHPSVVSPPVASKDSKPSDPIFPDCPGQPGSTPVNPRPRSETLESYSSIVRWRPTYMQSPTFSEPPTANCEQRSPSSGQRRDSDCYSWQQKSMEAYLLHLPSPEFMAVGRTLAEAQSKDEALDIKQDLK